MKRLFYLILILFKIFYTSESAYAQTQQKIVVIDAGHGGKDPGAIGKSSYEKNITLAIALKVGTYLETYLKNVDVVYTRKTDVFVELHRRAEIANQKKADLFVSIHVNSSENSKPHGTSTFVMGLNKSKENIEAAKRENNVILQEKNYETNYKGFDPNSPEMDIIFNLFQNEYLKQSVDLAQRIQTQFEKRANRHNRGVKQAGLVVLWQSTMPSVLVETGFISNLAEERYLNSTQGQDYIASAIYRAIRDYLKLTSNTVKYIPKKDDVYFTIQIKSTPKKLPLNHPFFKGLTNIVERKGATQYYYTVGKAKTPSELAQLQKKIRTKIPDAFAIGIKNEERIKYAKAKQILAKK